MRRTFKEYLQDNPALIGAFLIFIFMMLVGLHQMAFENFWLGVGWAGSFIGLIIFVAYLSIRDWRRKG